MWQIRVCGCNRTSVLHHPVFPLNVLNLGHDVVGENGKFVSHVIRRVKNDACRQCSLNTTERYVNTGVFLGSICI